MRRGVRYFEIIASYVHGSWKMANCPRCMHLSLSLSIYVFSFFLSPFRKVASRMRGKWGCISEFRNSNREDFYYHEFLLIFFFSFPFSFQENFGNFYYYKNTN